MSAPPTRRKQADSTEAHPALRTRRAVLQGGLVATAAACLPPATWAAQPAADAPERQAKCTLGFSTYGMKTVSTEQAIATLESIGFDSLELAVRSGWDADSSQLTAARRNLLRKRLDNSRLRLTSLMEHVFPTDDRQQAIALERLRMAAGVAHDLAPSAPPHIQTVLGGGNFDQRKHQLRDRLAAWVEIAESTHTTIAVKPHRGGVVSQPAEAAWLIEQLGRPARLRMVYDYSHYAFRDLPMAETIRTALPYTTYIAVKDAVQRNGNVAFELPGQAGTIDFARLLKQFTAGGYRGDINCEVSGMVSNKPDYDPVAAAKFCYTKLTATFREAGVARPA